MNSITVVVGIVQLIIAVLFAVIALYIGFSVFGKVTRDVDEQKELAKEMKELQKEFGDDKTKAPQSGSMRDRVNQILNEDK